MPIYVPPFQLTHRMTVLVADMAEQQGAWKAANLGTLVPELRRCNRSRNRIRTLQASPAIELNTLSVEQVNALLAGDSVLASPKIATQPKVETPVQMQAQTRVERAVRTPEHVLVALRDQSELALSEVAQAIGRALSAVERAATRLQAQGRVRHVGPKKGGRWDVV